MILEVRHLALIDAIADAGSVTRAAERLHLTQSAVSHQLIDLEAKTGVQFFTRLGRRMLLTAAGERVRTSAQRVLDDLRRTEDDLAAMAAGTRGVLRLCTECNTGYHWLPPLLHEFHARFPQVDVQIKVEATHRPLQALVDGEIDLAVITSTARDPRIVTEPIFEDELMAIVSPSHPFAARAYIEAADFTSEHLLLHRADRRQSYTFSRILAPAGVEPARLSEVPLTEAIVELIRANLGIGVMASWAIDPARRSGAVTAVRIGRTGVRRTWTAATLRDRPQAAWMVEFVKLLAARGPSRVFCETAPKGDRTAALSTQRDHRLDTRRSPRRKNGRQRANRQQHGDRR